MLVSTLMITHVCSVVVLHFSGELVYSADHIYCIEVYIQGTLIEYTVDGSLCSRTVSLER